MNEVTKSKTVIKSVRLKNFKNFAKLSFDFNDTQITNLVGKTGSGKSTILMAWLWVCGLDVESPYPKLNNKLIEDLETNVEFTIEQNAMQYVLSRTATQKWKVDKQNGTREFNGYDASQFIFDGTPMNNATAYKEKLCSLFGIEKYESLKYLCISNFFNADNGATWGWKNRRELLYKICGVDKALTTIIDKAEFALIANELRKGKTTTELLKQLNTEKRDISNKKETNEILLNDKQAELNQYSSYDFVGIKNEIEKLEIEIVAENQSLQVGNDKGAELELAKQLSELQNQITRLQTQDNMTENLLASELQKITNIVENLKVRMSRTESELSRAMSEYKTLKESEWHGECECPTCRRPLESHQIQELTTTFENDKQSKITTVLGAIKGLKTTLDNDKQIYAEKMELLVIAQENVAQHKSNPLIEELQGKKSQISNKIIELQNSNVIAETTRLEQLKINQNELKEKLAFKQVKANVEARIASLKSEQLDLTQAEIENAKKRQCLENYTLETIKLVNDTINQKFDGIEWNLFNTRTATAESAIEEDCVVMMEGKTYNQLSAGEKVMADFLTIKGLQKAFNVNLPLWVDNAQDCILERDCTQQRIELVTLPQESNLIGTKINDIYGKGE